MACITRRPPRWVAPAARATESGVINGVLSKSLIVFSSYVAAEAHELTKKHALTALVANATVCNVTNNGFWTGNWRTKVTLAQQFNPLKNWLVKGQDVDALKYLCDRANDLEVSAKSEKPDWYELLDQLRRDAESLADAIKVTRKEKIRQTEVKREIDGVSKQLKQETLPSITLRRRLKKTLGRFEPKTYLEFNASSGNLMRIDNFDDATNDQLIALLFCFATQSRNWQLLRRCPKPDCRKYFCDTTKGNVTRYCSTAHNKQHQNSKPRENEE